MDKLLERFLQYVSLDTQSKPGVRQVPSTEGQWKLLRLLQAQLEEMGLVKVTLSEKGTVMGTLPANVEGDIPAIGFISHVDTSPDFSGKNVNPQIVENYRGGDIALGIGDEVLSPVMFPVLHQLLGQTLITTDGKTLLGADDKAGIAEILTMVEYIILENVEHGPLCIAFTPDEEIGMGAEHFNLSQFGADYAYTVDGDTEGEIQYENFNAAKAEFTIKGFNVHPGSAKDTMINASLVAMEINNALPAMETPRDTEDYEGFYHLISMSGDVSKAHLSYIIRDHDITVFEARKKTLQHIEKIINEKWGAGTATLTMTDQYYNMASIIKDCMQLIDKAKEACIKADVKPLILPIRGGTDGCLLSYKGLPCPNLGTAGHAYHGPYEHITVEGMDMVVNTLIELVKCFC